ncbi:MAG: cobalt ECF transporter T component CbiQ [Candidatus Omnitrophica bacterium]|nr:cobalt ECF transporter T component CbiQ [Candidatus Omnitrophota bacterium]
MINEAFSDYFAQKENYLSKIDARIKAVFAVGAIIIILASKAFGLALIVACLSLVFLLGVKIPAKILLVRLAAPLGIAAVILITHIFFYGSTALFKFSIFGFQLMGYKEGLFRGILIISKVTGCVALIMFLSMTTPVNNLLQAARWFRLPVAWIEIAMLTYRYIFVLLQDIITVKDAQRVRLGYCNFSTSLRSFGELIGSAVIRAYDQSVSTYEAMQNRGYSGTTKVFFEDRFRAKDGLQLILFSIILSLLLILSIYWR